MKSIILASKSRDRKEILKTLKIPFKVLSINIDEEEFKNRVLEPIELVRQLAKAKAQAAKELLAEKKRESIIIAADTIVELNGAVIGKASNQEEAFQILTKLAGNWHNLITGIAICENRTPKMIVDYNITRVHFKNLSNDELNDYIKTGEWKGRAGAYSIRENASLFIDSINGSFSNVIGLPMDKLYSILKKEFKVDLLTL